MRFKKCTVLDSSRTGALLDFSGELRTETRCGLLCNYDDDEVVVMRGGTMMTW